VYQITATDVSGTYPPATSDPISVTVNAYASYAVADYTDYPATSVVPGQQNVNVMNLIVTNPNAAAGPYYKLVGVTLTVSTSNNNCISSVFVKDSAGNIINSVAWGGGSTQFVPVDALSNTASAGIAGGASATYTIGLDISAAAPDTGFNISVQQPLSLDVQKLDGTVLYVQPNTNQFPFTSNRISVISTNTSSSFYNFPNPFKPGANGTTIQYYLASDAKVSFAIYDLISRRVKTIVGGEQQQGGQIYRYTWDGTNDIHKTVIDGVYYGVLKIADKEYFTKIVVIK